MSIATPPERQYAPPAARRRQRAWIPNLLLSLLLLVILGGVAACIAFFAVIGQLPSIAVLDDPNRLGFKTAQIFDRKGQLLWEINDPSGGKRTVISLRDMAPDLLKATLAAEDARFYEHPGFDPGATLRSAWVDVTRQGSSGASTITQQLVRNVVLEGWEIWARR